MQTDSKFAGRISTCKVQLIYLFLNVSKEIVFNCFTIISCSLNTLLLHIQNFILHYSVIKRKCRLMIVQLSKVIRNDTVKKGIEGFIKIFNLKFRFYAYLLLIIKSCDSLFFTKFFFIHS